jgi:diacylglycerol kinase
MTQISFKDSAFCAARGLFRSISSERNIKIQIFIGAVIIFTAFLLQISRIYLITIIIVCFLVIILELFNRCFEKLIDLVSPEYNKEFGKVKDAIAGIVLLTFSMAMIVAALILYEPIIILLKEISKKPFSIFIISANIILFLAVILTIFIKSKN